MPSMHGESAQCCLCIVGVFLFLGGVLMLATGISLILNYGVSRDIILPTLQSEEDKKNVGIALTGFGAVCMIISIIVSIIYLCSKSKSNSRVAPDISKASRKVITPDPSRLPSASKVIPQHVTDVPGSATITQRPKQKKKKRHLRPRVNFVGKLAGIQEADSVSKKALEESARELEDYSVSNERSRSGSMSSSILADDGKHRKDYLPNIHNRSSMQSRQSLGSASTLDDSVYSQNIDKLKLDDTKAWRTNSSSQNSHELHSAQNMHGTSTISFGNEAFEDDTTASNENTLPVKKLIFNQGYADTVTPPLSPYLGNNKNDVPVTEDPVSRLKIPSWGLEESGFQVQTPHSDSLSLI